MNDKKKLFIHLGKDTIQPLLTGASNDPRLMVPKTIAHEKIWYPENIGKIGELEKEIVNSPADYKILSPGRILCYFFASTENVNYKSKLQGEAIRSMIRGASRTHDIVLLYYMSPVFDSLKDIYQKYQEDRGTPTRHTQDEFEKISERYLKALHHHKNIESWKEIDGVGEIIARPEQSINHLKDVLSVVGASYNSRETNTRDAQQAKELIVSEKISELIREVYPDNKMACEEHFSNKEKRAFLETFYPYVGDVKPRFSIKRFIDSFRF